MRRDRAETRQRVSSRSTSTTVTGKPGKRRPRGDGTGSTTWRARSRPATLMLWSDSTSVARRVRSVTPARSRPRRGSSLLDTDDDKDADRTLAAKTPTGKPVADRPTRRHGAALYSLSHWVPPRPLVGVLEPVKILVIGSGAREHALVRGAAADPSVTGVAAAPGNPGIAAWPTPTRWTRPTRRGRRAGRRARRRPGRHRSRGAAGRRGRRRGPGRGHRLLRAVRGGRRSSRGQQGVRQGRHGGGRRPDRARPRLRRRWTRSPPRSTSSARRTWSRTTGSPPARAWWSPTTGTRRCAHARGLRRGSWSRSSWTARRSRCSPQRRRDGRAAGARAGLQAVGDDDAGPEHRRDGRLLAAAVGAGRPGRRGDARRRCSRRSTRWPGGARRSPGCSTAGWR